jgi:hypothetical protein
MAVNADAFTISAVLLLIVGAICFYLFTRIKQTEKKLALMEGILLDLKTATEAAFLDFPAPPQGHEEEDEEEEEEQASSELEFLPTLPEESAATLDAEELDAVAPAAAEIRSLKVTATTHQEEDAVSVSESNVQVNKLDSAADLESLSVAELASIARSKGITGTGKMRKNQLIASIKEHVGPLPEQPLEVDGMAAGSSLLDSSSLMSSPL